MFIINGYDRKNKRSLVVPGLLVFFLIWNCKTFHAKTLITRHFIIIIIIRLYIKIDPSQTYTFSNLAISPVFKEI